MSGFQPKWTITALKRIAKSNPERARAILSNRQVLSSLSREYKLAANKLALWNHGVRTKGPPQ